MFRNITFFGLFFLLLLNSCKVTKYVGEEQQLLTKNTIVFEKGYKVENRTALKNEMLTLYKQVPNKKKLTLFKTNLWLHFILKNSEADTMRIRIKNGIPDTIHETSLEKAIRRIAVKRWSEPPALFKEELMEDTRLNMTYFLRNRGFREAEVEATTYSPPEGKRKQKISKKIEVTYLVKPKRQIKIDSVEFFSEDPVIHKIINEVAATTFLKKNAPVDERLYDLEVNRITSLLREKGYARFTPNYIPKLEGDTTDFKAKIKFTVKPPARGEVHQKYTIGKVRIVPNYQPFGINLVDTLIGDYHFVKEKGTEFWLKPNILEAPIYLKPGDLYQLSLVTKTNRKLSDLGVYNFISLRQEIDSTQKDIINFDILLSPRKKYESGYDVEPNWTERTVPGSQVNNLLGLAAGTYFGNKNTFRGAEYLTTNIYSGFEFDLNRNNDVPILNTIDLRANVDLNLPRFNDYFGLYKMLRKAKILRKPFFDNMSENARTLIRSGYNYVSLFGFYDLHSFNASIGYDMQSRYNRFQINNLAIDVLRPDFKASFQSQLNTNLFLKNSFGDQLFSGFLLRDVNYLYNSRTNSFGEKYFFQINTEISGAEIYGANKLYNSLADKIDTFMLGNSLEFSQYGRIELAVSYTRKFNPNHAVAVRFYSGAGRPFGFSETLPYLKQFYSGGPNSIRAWSAREIGPGSYRDPLTASPINRFRFYQTGDFKMELNGEYRFKLFKFFIDYEGAVFLDIGNNWTFENDPQRPGSQLTWNQTKDVSGNIINDNFLKELAIGTGFGLRLDFSYFLLRLDMGLPVKNNYRTFLPDDNKWTYAAFSNLGAVSTSDINYNLGLNYPF